jgi:hypothetical protein
MQLLLGREHYLLQLDVDWGSLQEALHREEILNLHILIKASVLL